MLIRLSAMIAQSTHRFMRPFLAITTAPHPKESFERSRSQLPCLKLGSAGLDTRMDLPRTDLRKLILCETAANKRTAKLYRSPRASDRRGRQFWTLQQDNRTDVDSDK